MDLKRIESEEWNRPAGLRAGLLLICVVCAGLLACKEKPGRGGESHALKTEAPTETAKPEASPAVAAQTLAAKPEAAPTLAKPVVPQEAAKPQAPQAAAKPEFKTGKIDFNLPLTPITMPLAGLSGFAGRKLLVFYFGPTCPHCQAALPEVQSFAEEIRGKGYETVAVANQRSTPDEIQEFISKYKCTLPVFWDEERKFGGAYRIAVLPTIFLVKSGGDFIQMDGFSGKPALELLRRGL